MKPPSWVLVGERLRRGAAATFAVWEPAVRWGAGLFETVGCDGGRPLLWDAHANRLERGLAELGWSGCRLPSAAAVQRLLDRCQLHGPGVVRVVASLRQRRTTAVAWASPYRPPRTARRLGVRLATVPLPTGPLHGLKNCSYLPHRWARARARQLEADAALLVDGDGAVRESDTANLFIASAGTVTTPPAPGRCLPGVMRGWCLGALRGAGIAVVERDLVIDEVLGADEVWLTSSLAGIVPVRRIDGSGLPVPRKLVGLLARHSVPAPGMQRG